MYKNTLCAGWDPGKHQSCFMQSGTKRAKRGNHMANNTV